MKKLLLTGFGPFLTNDRNPTSDIVQKLDGSKLGQYEVYGEILPVEFGRSADKLKEVIDDIQPDAIILLGLASGRSAITPERIAINCNDGGQADNAGYIPQGEAIVKDGPDGLFTSLPVHDMVEAMKAANIPARLSNSAGTYVCNHVMYEALYHHKQKGVNTPTGFIHVPANYELALSKNIPSMAQDDIEKAIKICIQTLT